MVTDNMYRKFAEIWTCVFCNTQNRQTYRAQYNSNNPAVARHKNNPHLQQAVRQQLVLLCFLLALDSWDRQTVLRGTTNIINTTEHIMSMSPSNIQLL